MYLVGFARLRAAFTGRNCFELQLFLRHVLFVSRVFMIILQKKYLT